MIAPARLALAALLAAPLAACGQCSSPEAPPPAATTAPPASPAAPAAAAPVAPAPAAAAPRRPSRHAAATAAAAAAPPGRLHALAFGGADYEAHYVASDDAWTFDRWAPEQAGERTLMARVYLDPWRPKDWPLEAEAFASRLARGGLLDPGVTWRVEAIEPLDGGWIILGSTEDGDARELAFVARLDKHDALCRGYVLEDTPAARRLEVRDDAIGGCKGVVPRGAGTLGR